MTIAGLQKMTLLDYPGKVACTVFLEGCNFRCPFCHNSGLLSGQQPDAMDMDALLTFLSRRKGLLDAVCVSGGEPTLTPELPELLRRIRALGFAVKLDTNGSRPDVLEKLLTEGLVDYVAMDVKNSPARYAETVGCPGVNLADIERSLQLLITGSTDYELRTTVVQELHDETSIQDMGAWLQGLCPGYGVKKIFLQPFVDRDSVLRSGLHAPETPQIAGFAHLLQNFASDVKVRG